MARSKNLDAFKIHYNMMLTSGIWPNENPDIIYKMRTLISWFLSLGVNFCMWLEAFNDTNDFAKFSEIVYVMVLWDAYLIKLVAFTYYKKTFLNMIEFLKDPIFMSYPDELDHHMARAIRVSTTIANTFRYLLLCCVCLYLIYPILDNVPLPFPFPYDLGKYRYLMYAFQVAGVGCAAWNNSCLDTLCTSLMGFGAAQLDILAEKITQLEEQENCEISERKDQNVIKHLKQCVEHHLAIIKFIELIDHVFTFGLLVQFLASILVICYTLFQFLWITLSWKFVLLSEYFISVLLELFLYCWYGNEIITKSTKVGEACYMSKWNKHDKEVCRYLFLIMERSKRPLKITTMRFSVLSLNAFGAILHWSYSCLALLLNMYDKQVVEQ